MRLFLGLKRWLKRARILRSHTYRTIVAWMSNLRSSSTCCQIKERVSLRAGEISDRKCLCCSSRAKTKKGGGRLYLHDLCTLSLLLRLDRHVERDPDLLALEAEVQLVRRASVLLLEHALLDQDRQHRFERLGVETGAGLEVAVREGVRPGRLELEEDAGLVRRDDEKVLLRRVQRAEPAFTTTSGTFRASAQFESIERKRGDATRCGSAARASSACAPCAC